MLTKKAVPKNKTTTSKIDSKVTASTINSMKNIQEDSSNKNVSHPLKQLTKALSNALIKSTNGELETQKKPNPTTRVIIKYDAGFSNQLYIRGKGANLSWDKGLLLKNVKTDEWVWETDEIFTLCEFKVLFNDFVYETGDNHLVRSGVTLLYMPHFNF